MKIVSLCAGTLLFTTLVSVTVAESKTPKPSEIRGQVNFVGKLPDAEAQKISGDKFCEQVHASSPIMKDDIVINGNNTVKNVVVWISSGGPDQFYQSKGKDLPAATLLEENCRVFPRVIALQTGQKLVVKNNDQTINNINSQPRFNPRFNYALMPGGDSKTLQFDKAEVPVKLKNDIHPWMVSWALVFDHPGYAITGEDGRFVIKDVPPGEYTLEAWQEKFGTVKAYVLVQEDVPANVVFTYNNQGSKSGTQTDAKGNVTTGTIEQPR